MAEKIDMAPRVRAVQSICPTTDCHGEVRKAEQIWGKEHYDNVMAVIRNIMRNEQLICFTCTRCRALIVTDLKPQ